MEKKDKSPQILKIVRWIFPKIERIAPFLAHRFFVKLFFSPLHYAVPEKEEIAVSHAEKFIVYASGKKIQCYRWGNGASVVLLVHGWGGRATQFRRFIKPLLREGFQIVGFDGPAHGNSSGRTTNILEFDETLKEIYKLVGNPSAVITHSFGGGAVLYSITHGLPVPKLITIACPSIGDEIINTYLRAINGSEKTKKFFKDYMIKTFNKSFDEFTALKFVEHLDQNINWLLVHDENDKEVSIDHANALLKAYPKAKFYKTKGLGHTRILKNDDVIRDCVTYIKN